MTVLADLMEQREQRNRREHYRYYVQRVLSVSRSAALLLFAIWCLNSRHQIQAFLTHLLAP